MGGSANRTNNRGGNSGQWNSSSGPAGWALPDYRGALDEARRIYNERKRRGIPDLSEGTRRAIEGAGRMPGTWNDLWSSEKNLGGVAGGSEMGINNPEFLKNLQNALDTSASTINSQFAGAGRAGSAANTGVLGRELGNISSQAVQDQFNLDREAQLRANQQIDAARGNRLTGQGNAWENAFRGSSLQDKWNQQNYQSAWNDLQRWQDAIGKGTGGATEGSGSTSGSGNQWGNSRNDGNSIGDISNIIGGLGRVAKSDRRLKVNITYIGTKKGFKMYEFNYLPAVKCHGRFRGVMAQDILQTHPKAVTQGDADGFYVVNYSALSCSLDVNMEVVQADGSSKSIW